MLTLIIILIDTFLVFIPSHFKMFIKTNTEESEEGLFWGFLNLL